MKTFRNCHLVFPFLLALQVIVFGEEPAPNIIVMMADDMGLGDTSAYQDLTGNSDIQQIHTPHMERLARMGVLFSDAHTPSSRCSTTRYGLLTGRYSWRNRLKYWVLFGVQGDPMIERDRPTIASLLKDQGYATAMVGKWHVGLRYRQSDELPADAWDDAVLTLPMYDTPLDHGFDQCWFTSRSHGTSGPNSPMQRNHPEQAKGPGHIHGRTIVAATGNGKQLKNKGPDVYILDELGGRHSDHAIEFLTGHLQESSSQEKPFFLYYPSNSNHSPYTSDSHVGDVAVAGAARNVAGEPMNVRSDFVYENDVALGRLLDYLQENDDPRRPGHPLIENTLVIFTSDNGAEIKDKTATGPWRSNKGSAYEGGHRVPFIAACPAAGIGDGDDSTPGKTNHSLACLTDLYATFAELVGSELPDLRHGEKGAEDSLSLLPALQGKSIANRPMFYNDHSEAEDPAACAMRLDDPVVDGKTVDGKWKIFFNADLLRKGVAHPVELFELASDSKEENDRLGEQALKPLVDHLVKVAEHHRNSGGHRYADITTTQRKVIDWSSQDSAGSSSKIPSGDSLMMDLGDGITMTVKAEAGKSGEKIEFSPNPRGLGISGGTFKQVDDGEAIVVSFNRDVVVESAGIVAGNGQCGGFYRVGEASPMAIYCIDADIDDRDQSGLLSDIGFVKAGVPVRFDSSPHYGVETPGRWRMQSLTVRMLNETN